MRKSISMVIVLSAASTGDIDVL